MATPVQKIVPLFPRLIRFLFVSICISVVIFNLMRVVFFLVFNSSEAPPAVSELMKAFFIGFKFDLRLALLIHMPILLLGWIKPLRPVPGTFGVRLWIGWLTAANTLCLLIYLVDFGNYAYLQSRIDATVFSLLENVRESMLMVWQTYPIVWGVLGLAVFALAYAFCLKRILNRIHGAQPHPFAKWKKVTATVLAVFFYLFGIYGKFSYYPLRWSDAFFSTRFWVTSVALNPVLFIWDTHSGKRPQNDYNIEEVRQCYDLVADYLKIPEPDRDALNFKRVVSGNPAQSPMNVILVFLESFAWHRAGVSGNPLNPSPHFDAMAAKSLLFTRYYVPHPGTARSIFTAVTGLPDVELETTSSRNPLAVNQHSIINHFEGSRKFYFLGGSASWGEIRGLLAHNIPNIRIYEEGDYTSKRYDVWGISDLNLFEEANQVLSQVKDAPFFAIIQTSGNHRPYTIPDDNHGFELREVDAETVRSYGFENIEAFNAFRFMDHSIGVFLDQAAKEEYFNRTIFVFFGDHGITSQPKHMPPSESDLRLSTYHIPLLIYAPGLMQQGQVRTQVASSVDLLPTIASLASIPYVNTTLGRNLMDESFASSGAAFTIMHYQNPIIGLIGDDFYYLSNADGTNRNLHRLDARNPLENVIKENPEAGAKMGRLCGCLYETARYMRYHNANEKGE